MNAALTYHHTQSLILDEHVADIGSVSVGKTWVLPQTITVDANIALMSEAKVPWLYDVSARIPALAELTVMAGAARRPLAVEVPLAGTATGLQQDTAFGEIAWGDTFSWRSSLLRDVGQTLGESHAAHLRLPLHVFTRSGQTLDFLTAAALVSRPAPSPFYETWRRSVDLDAGFGVRQSAKDTLGAQGALLYRHGLRQGYGDDRWHTVAGFDLAASLTKELSKEWRLSAGLRYLSQTTARPERPREERIAVSAAIDLLL